MILYSCKCCLHYHSICITIASLRESISCRKVSKGWLASQLQMGISSASKILPFSLRFGYLFSSSAQHNINLYISCCGQHTARDGSSFWASAAATDCYSQELPSRTAWQSCGLSFTSSCLPCSTLTYGSMSGSARTLKAMLRTKHTWTRVSLRFCMGFGCRI